MVDPKGTYIQPLGTKCAAVKNTSIFFQFPVSFLIPFIVSGNLLNSLISTFPLLSVYMSAKLLHAATLVFFF
jgi:hypothetical protein